MDRVTITGADDNTPISALLDLSAEFPFVEWGILVSQKQEGSHRFPSRDWSTSFAVRAADFKAVNVKVSMHVCGEWVRRILRGRMDWNDLPHALRVVADRIQLNTHAEEHVSCVSMFEWMHKRSNKQFIIQLDGVNDHLLYAGITGLVNVAGLFDCSHGAGVLPEKWPEPCHYAMYQGYAGGLGPENVAEQVPRIAAAMRTAQKKWGTNPPWWIDMEGRVRTDERLDLTKVRRVLEVCAPLIDRAHVGAESANV